MKKKTTVQSINKTIICVNSSYYKYQPLLNSHNKFNPAAAGTAENGDYYDD